MVGFKNSILFLEQHDFGQCDQARRFGGFACGLWPMVTLAVEIVLGALGTYTWTQTKLNLRLKGSLPFAIDAVTDCFIFLVVVVVVVVVVVLVVVIVA